MRTIVLVLALAVAALAAPQYEPIFKDYHEEIGKPLYERIKASEEAEDFDGSRIAGGAHARVGQFPFMGGLRIALASGTSTCGSSLVSNRAIVTAAHCWRHGSNQGRSLTIVLGNVRLNAAGITTNQVTMHANYDERNLANDVAIARFNPIGLNNNVNRINLAAGANLFVGTQAYAVGFGRTGDNVGIPANQPLSFVRLPVITNAECARTYGGAIIASTLCTSGAGNRGVCPGDSGGPLAVGNTLIGVASFASSRGCARGYPGGFARVSSFNAWIQARI